MRFDSANASAVFSLTRGGRLASLVVHGHELIITAGDDEAFGWGSFPMVPYAGRVAAGRFSSGGVDHTLPITMTPNAIHGTAWTQAWQRLSDTEMGAELGAAWPLGGAVTQTIELTDDYLEVVLTVTAGDHAMPAMVGWHPWFRRRLLQDPSVSAQLEFDASTMYELDDVMIPTGRRTEPSEGPWDSCFTDVAQPLSVTWPGAVRLDLTSTCDHWVVYDRPDHAVCVEPQSGAPDAFNQAPVLLGAGQSLTESFRMTWTHLGGDQ